MHHSKIPASPLPPTNESPSTSIPASPHSPPPQPTNPLPQEALRLKEAKSVDEVVAVSAGPQQCQVRGLTAAGAAGGGGCGRRCAWCRCGRAGSSSGSGSGSGSVVQAVAAAVTMAGAVAVLVRQPGGCHKNTVSHSTVGSVGMTCDPRHFVLGGTFRMPCSQGGRCACVQQTVCRAACRCTSLCIPSPPAGTKHSVLCCAVLCRRRCAQHSPWALTVPSM
jgi:hypothetical protein